MRFTNALDEKMSFNRTFTAFEDYESTRLLSEVEAISYSLLCRWFRTAILPQDKELETALFHRLNAKKCAVCGALFTPGSNRAKYCPECAARMKRINAAKRKRKQREK